MRKAIESGRRRQHVVIALCALAVVVALGQPAEMLGARSAGASDAKADNSATHEPKPASVRSRIATTTTAVKTHKTLRRVRPRPTTTLAAPTVSTTVAPTVTTTSSVPLPLGPPHASILPGGTGSFDFNGYAPLSDRPLKVWYAAPAGDLTWAKVIVVMHGQSRGGESYRDSWIEEARRAGALLVVPEFSDSLYPGSDAYNLGNVGIEPESRWSYSMIEPLFDYVQADTGNRTDGYVLYGHSAGAQFVHRFLLLVPNNRVKRAVAANAGWYTAPELNVAFPYGLRGSPVTDTGLRRALAKPLTILLGEDDTDPNDPDLRHSAGADRQGLTRLARGYFFYQAGLSTATALGTPFGWTLRTVPGVGHTNSGMVPAAARVIFG